MQVKRAVRSHTKRRVVSIVEGIGIGDVHNQGPTRHVGGLLSAFTLNESSRNANTNRYRLQQDFFVGVHPAHGYGRSVLIKLANPLIGIREPMPPSPNSWMIFGTHSS